MQEVRGSTELFLGFQVGQVVGGAVASTCCLMMRRLLAIVLRKVPFINGSSNRITPRAWVSIISSSLVLAGATGANVARACSVNGPNRDTSVKLLTGWYSVTSMLPWSCRPRSVRTSRAVVPTPIGPGDVWVMEVTAGSHLKRFASSGDMAGHHRDRPQWRRNEYGNQWVAPMRWMPRSAAAMTSARVSPARLASSTPLRLDHSASTGLRSGA